MIYSPGRSPSFWALWDTGASSSAISIVAAEFLQLKKVGRIVANGIYKSRKDNQNPCGVPHPGGSGDLLFLGGGMFVRFGIPLSLGMQAKTNARTAIMMRIVVIL